MKTYSAKAKDIVRKWYIVDATDKVLGRISTEIAMRLMGKHKPTYSPNLDMGDFIIVINADKVKVTGKKLENKKYYKHTGYLGGLKENTLGELMEKDPTKVIRNSIRLMLPKTRLGRKMLKKLKVYTGSDHPHKSQKPEELEIQ
ncbi:MAG: 50S ribosomal protein L13 [Bacteroidales bacterium]